MLNKVLSDERVTGIHYVLDLFACDSSQIDCSATLQKILKDSIQDTDITLITEACHKFDPCGVTAFVLLSTSHISLHSWPEHGYVSIDVYSCSAPAMTRKVVDHLIERIRHGSMVIRRIDRTYDLPSASNPATAVLTLARYKGGEQLLHIQANIETVNSAYQQIQIVDTQEFARCMLIDGILQLSQKDHHLYDMALLAAASPNDKELIVLGGGDGFVAQTALQLNPALRVSIADLDAEVAAAAKRHFDQTVFDHPHVQIHFTDALTFLSSRNGPPVDGIVCDLTDQPVTSDSSDREQSYRGFFAHLLTLAKSHLKPGGWISLQAGASFATPRYLQTSHILLDLVMSHFHSVSSQDLLIPSFGEENRFIIGWKA